MSISNYNSKKKQSKTISIVALIVTRMRYATITFIFHSHMIFGQATSQTTINMGSNISTYREDHSDNTTPNINDNIVLRLQKGVREIISINRASWDFLIFAVCALCILKAIYLSLLSKLKKNGEKNITAETESKM